MIKVCINGEIVEMTEKEYAKLFAEEEICADNNTPATQGVS